MRNLVTLRHMPVNAATGYGIHEFLAREALLLDHEQYEDWTTLLARDLTYCCPVHLLATTVEPAVQPSAQTTREYDYEFLTRYARAAQRTVPISGARAVRRLLTNVIVEMGPSSNTYDVTSYVLLIGAEDATPGLPLSAIERHDVLRRCALSYQLTHRTISPGTLSAEVLRAVHII